MNNWLLLILSLPTENATVRMRAWRALKASGAAVLRDGVYLMPTLEHCAETLESIAVEVQEGAGSAWVLRVEAPSDADFAALFDRREDYAALLADVHAAQDRLGVEPAQDTLKTARKLRKALTQLATIDFFPGEAARQAEAAVIELESAAAHALTPDEPHPKEGAISRLRIKDFQGQVWATRKRPWVDRLASAWLIQRFIDPDARFIWLDQPENCPSEALGFDFDGARFTHVGPRVTLEVLLASFGLVQPALQRLGLLVHYLDVGGVQPPEAVGVESVLSGLRAGIADDDQLLAAAATVFDSLLVAFENGSAINE